jgi:hypothetical protein
MGLNVNFGKMKVIRILVKLILYLPWVYIMLFYSYVLRAYLKLGRLPTYNNPDPKELNFDLHRRFVYWSFDIGIYSIVLSIILILLSFKLKSIVLGKRDLLLWVIVLVFFFFNILFDPLDTWFLD